MIIFKYMISITTLLELFQNSVFNITSEIENLTYVEEDRAGFQLVQNVAFLKKGTHAKNNVQAFQDCLLYSSALFYYSVNYNLKQIFQMFNVSKIWLNGRFDARVHKTIDPEDLLHPILTESDSIKWRQRLTAVNQCVSLEQIKGHSFRLTKERCDLPLNYLCMVKVQVSRSYLENFKSSKEKIKQKLNDLVQQIGILNKTWDNFVQNLGHFKYPTDLLKEPDEIINLVDQKEKRIIQSLNTNMDALSFEMEKNQPDLAAIMIYTVNLETTLDLTKNYIKTLIFHPEEFGKFDPKAERKLYKANDSQELYITIIDRNITSRPTESNNFWVPGSDFYDVSLFDVTLSLMGFTAVTIACLQLCRKSCCKPAEYTVRTLNVRMNPMDARTSTETQTEAEVFKVIKRRRPLSELSSDSSSDTDDEMSKISARKVVPHLKQVQFQE